MIGSKWMPVAASGCRLPGTEKEGEGRSPRSGTGEERGESGGEGEGR